MTDHDERSPHRSVLDSDLREIVRKVAAMGGLAEKQITDAVRALVDHDTELAATSSPPIRRSMQCRARPSKWRG
jgi:phosphate uptake regulator